jgi:hypothetical protein
MFNNESLRKLLHTKEDDNDVTVIMKQLLTIVKVITDNSHNPL